MALFGITDIQIDPAKPRNYEPSINQGNSARDAQNFRYPMELGTAPVGHYMLFTIFAQDYEKRSQGVSEAIGGFSDAAGTTTNRTAIDRGNVEIDTGFVPGNLLDNVTKTTKFFGEKLSQHSGQLTNLLNAATNKIGMDSKTKQEIATQLANSVKNVVDNLNLGDASGPRFLNRVRKIQNNIALYMPDSLQFSYNQSYSDVSTNFGMTQAAANIIAGITAGGKPGLDFATKNMTPFIYEAISSLGDIGKVNFIAATNQVLNPQLELIYSSPNFREFNFQFAFYPRSKREAEQVFKIINLLKFHQAPEIKNGDAGFFLIPPSLFDIDFMVNGEQNKNLPQLSSCVLTRIDVDYAPNGWSAYETSDRYENGVAGGTGTPVATRLNLSFKETFIHSKTSHKDWKTDSR